MSQPDSDKLFIGTYRGLFVLPDAPKILIIAEDVLQLKKAAEFLARRGWKATVVSDLRSAMECMTKDTPTHVLISVNLPLLPVQKIATFAKELETKYGVTCVAFGEREDLFTVRAVTGCGLQYSIFPPVTGALLHIKLKKVLLNEASEPKSRLVSSKTAEDVASNIVKGEVPNVQVRVPNFRNLRRPILSERDLQNRQFKKADENHRVSEIRSLENTTEFELESETSFKGHCISFAGTETTFLHVVSEVCVMTIKCGTMAGYVVLGRVQSQGSENKILLRNYGDNLVNGLKKRGIAVTDVHFLNIKVDEVEFEKLTRQCAQFCFVADHMGSETALAYLPYQEGFPSITPSQDFVGRLVVDKAEIASDVEVSFNLYFFLEKNNRSVLFAKRGSQFTSERWQRLESSQSPLFIDSLDEVHFRSYHAQNNLNLIIRSLSNEATV